MKNWKKAGLTALAGSLVATSAFAGAVTVSGTAALTYTANSGAQDTIAASGTNIGQDGNRWGLNKSLSFAGSGEMDNGWTVSVSQTLKDGSSTGLGMTLDMGDLGSLNYEADTGARGIGKIKDMAPTANEDVGDGLDVDGSGTAGGVSGRVSGGTQGFHYSKVISDMVEIGVGYGPKGQAGSSNGGVSGSGAGKSSTSAFIKLDPMDGLEIGFGMGQTANATVKGQANDHQTIYATYVYGPVTFGYQMSDVETYGSGTSNDESTSWSVLYAINDEMSISYGQHENQDELTTIDEEVEGISASYTMGSMSFVAHRNKGDNIGNAANKNSEHTEIGVSFSF
jgi:outer membrane protein OmpU